MIFHRDLQQKTTENWNIVYEEDYRIRFQANELKLGNVKNKLWYEIQSVLLFHHVIPPSPSLRSPN